MRLEVKENQKCHVTQLMLKFCTPAIYKSWSALHFWVFLEPVIFKEILFAALLCRTRYNVGIDN